MTHMCRRTYFIMRLHIVFFYFELYNQIILNDALLANEPKPLSSWHFGSYSLSPFFLLAS